MQPYRIALLINLAMLLTGGASVAEARDGRNETTQDIWEDPSQQPLYPPWYYWLSDDETVDQIMRGLEQRDPNLAEDLRQLRRRDTDRFRAELATAGAEEIQQITRERYEARRQRRQEQFVEWLRANYPREAEDLDRITEQDPARYARIFEHLQERYGPIFEAESMNPELGAVLKEDLELKERRDELLRRYRRERSDDRRREMGAELWGIVARRYDLIVRRKQIAYEQLRAKLEELQRQLENSKHEIDRSQERQVRIENIRARFESLTERSRRFRGWDD